MKILPVIASQTANVTVPEIQELPQPAQDYLHSLASPKSRMSMEACLRAVTPILTGNKTKDFNRVAWEQITYNHFMGLRRRLKQTGLSISTCNTRLAAVKGVLKHAFFLQLIRAATYLQIREVPYLSGEAPLRGRALTREQVCRLFEGCNSPEPKARRDAALLAILLNRGLRREEVASLHLNDLDISRGVLYINGKGNRRREVCLGSAALTILNDWLKVRTLKEGPLFCRILRGGHVRPQKSISTNTILNIVKERAHRAGLGHLSPHDLRRTCITLLLEADFDISEVSDYVGHSSISSTQRYDYRDETAQREAAAVLDIPFTPQRGSRAEKSPKASEAPRDEPDPFGPFRPNEDKP